MIIDINGENDTFEAIITATVVLQCVRTSYEALRGSNRLITGASCQQ